MNALLTLEGISRRFSPKLSLGDKIAAMLGASVETRAVRAVEDVTIELATGETLGLVGESGCGKSTLGRMAAGILKPSKGTILLDGKPVMADGSKVTTRIQTVFQDPFASLDPRMRVGDAIGEGPIAHGLVGPKDARDYVASWLGRVGLDEGFIDRYPHQFSGGQRQRIAIARALSMKPDILICDEPVASLDVSIQAQIINLFLELRRDLNITMLFISHDLGVVHHLCERVAIMYLGRIVELGKTADVYENPQHPYTQALLDSVPKLVLHDDALVEFKAIAGELPSPLAPPAGCHFHPRCPIAVDHCREEIPELVSRDRRHPTACHLAGETGT